MTMNMDKVEVGQKFQHVGTKQYLTILTKQLSGDLVRITFVEHRHPCSYTKSSSFRDWKLVGTDTVEGMKESAVIKKIKYLNDRFAKRKESLGDCPF